MNYTDLNLVGESPVFLEALGLIPKLAACDATVLIQGETGTGKELAARAIHYLSPRNGSPFIAINCGAIPEALVENELFGHVRGAYTDAREPTPGLIAQAEGGTLFLDEIEAIGVRAQVVLLRFLQNREYRPVGGGAARTANVRVIGSSNADLEALMRDGAYRRDLHFRLNVLSLELPPLRERGNDVILLAETFVKRFSRQYRKPVKPLHPDCRGYLTRQCWPGNVRELENLVHREVLLSEGPMIDLGARSRQLGTTPAPSAALTDSLFRDAKASAIARFERQYIVELLSKTDGNLSLAARLSGKERSRLGRLVKKYGLVRAGFGRGTDAP